MAKNTQRIKTDNAPQGDAGAPADTGQATGVAQDSGEATGAQEHPNPERAASDAAETVAGTAPTEADKTTKAPEPKVSDALAKAGKALLKSNPALDTVYMTADGTGFATKNDADNHAHNLKNKAVTPVKR